MTVQTDIPVVVTTPTPTITVYIVLMVETAIVEMATVIEKVVAI